MQVYIQNQQQYSQQAQNLNRKSNYISIFRLFSILAVLAFFYYYQQTNQKYFLGLAVLSLVLFVFLMRWHAKINKQKNHALALAAINTTEIDYLQNNHLPFADGSEFVNTNHPYSFDLDIFGNQSLFQHLNRTTTFVGKTRLAKQLESCKSKSEILQNQAAIAELSQKINWRQHFSAQAILQNDTQDAYKKLQQWTLFNNKTLSKSSRSFAFALPSLFFGFVVAYAITSNEVLLQYIGILFSINLGFLGLFMKHIQTEMAQTTSTNKSLLVYSQLLHTIETAEFQSQKLQNLQQQLVLNNSQASSHLKQLSGILSKLDATANLLVSVLFNGSFLFSLHTFQSLLSWKNKHASTLQTWLDVLGEMDMLCSLANFSYNNPTFAFPEISSTYQISFENLSHPLLKSKSRIGNSVAFHPPSFIILTGSNMSGKSTFLRSLGINIVLAGVGAAVCATKAVVHPMPVLVSMRLSDSLSDSQSYFFAEIKRLKQIMDSLQKAPSFVLLDEILRGTNSDDKRNGTIEVIKKIILQKAFGAIATHDVEVCLTTQEYPTILVNKCFEAQIINDNLHFDYQLHDGICQNKSASFLMKKMGVI